MPSHARSFGTHRTAPALALLTTLAGARTTTDLPAGTRWVFDHPFFMLLNLAVGGGWPGDPDGTTVFPQAMRVDYVRVYSR